MQRADPFTVDLDRRGTAVGAVIRISRSQKHDPGVNGNIKQVFLGQAPAPEQVTATLAG